MEKINRGIRKIIKNGRGSYYINIPKEIMRNIGWKERQKIVINQKGAKLIIADWKK
jgi:bifunctional DNA-binding transcriptional regulator/antitoxin component of YhaV-PrlF toxin-antitoxin module